MARVESNPNAVKKRERYLIAGGDHRGLNRKCLSANGPTLPLALPTDGAFVTGSDFFMDDGVTAAYRFGELAPK